MPVRAAVLVALDQNRVPACNQEPGSRVAREVVIQREIRAPERQERDVRLSDTDEARRRHRLANEPASEDLVQMAKGADAPSSAPVRCPGALWIAHGGAERFGVGATGGEARRWLHAGD